MVFTLSCEIDASDDSCCVLCMICTSKIMCGKREPVKISSHHHSCKSDRIFVNMMIIFCLLSTFLLVFGVDNVEIDALESLYDSTNGTGWNWVLPGNSTNGYVWDFTDTSNICEWQGITCDSTEEHISMLTLDDFNLVGYIPESIGNLSVIESLSLSSNDKLSGSLPLSFSKFSTVTNLEITKCNLSGSIPSSFDQMSQLAIINLATNKLTGVLPSGLLGLSTLERIQLYQNQLRGPIPEVIGNPASLSYLSLYQNSLTGTLPSSLGDNSKLVYLGFYTNQLKGPVPSSYGKLHRMQYFRTYENSLTGTLPAELAGMTDSIIIRMDNNRHTGPPPPFSFMPFLVYLNIESNYLSGQLPEAYANLSALQYLYLDNNNIGGSIPSSYGNLTRLKYFRVEDNKLTNTIPSNFGNMRSLEVFLVHINKLHGNLNGIFDPVRQPNMMNIDISSNKFRAKIPDELFEFPLLKTLSASVNCFDGKIPQSLCNAVNLEVLVLNGLRSGDGCPVRIFPDVKISSPMKGHIPSCLWELTNMTQIAISGNGFEGQLKPPATDSKLRNLTLSGNQLTGTIPNRIQKWPFEEVKLDFNKLTGTWSHPLANFSSNSTVMDLRVNRLSGNLPGPFEDGKKLRVLDGNVFSCDTHLPTDDPDYTSYVCGSSSLDAALEIFGYAIPAGMVIAIVWIAVVCFLERKGRDTPGDFIPEYKESVIAHYQQVVRWFQTPEWLIHGKPGEENRKSAAGAGSTVEQKGEENGEDDVGVEFHEMSDYIEFSSTMRWAVGWAVLVIILICVPLYPALKMSINDGDASTTEYQYSWFVSALFLKGYGPAMILMCVWTVAVGGFLVAIWKLLNHVSNRGVDSSQQLSVKEYFIAFVILAVNCVVVVVENYLFVVSQSSNYNASIKSTCQVAKSVFDLIWAFLISTTLRAVYVDVDANPEENIASRDYSSIRIWLAVSIKLFNDIVTPFLVSAVQDQSCLNRLLYPPDPISTTYTYTGCTYFSYNVDTEVFSCTKYEPITPVPAEYTPAFVYNNACTNSILRSFIPAIMYSYCIATFIVPWITIFLPTQIPLNKIPSLLQGIFMGMLFPTETETARDDLFDAELAVVGFMRDLSMFLTYGLTSPPLGIIIAFAMQFKSALLQVLVGRFLAVADSVRRHSNALKMERACRYDEDGVMACLFIVVITTAAFQALVMFDVLNDGQPVEHSYWASVLILVLAFSFAIVFSVGRRKEDILDTVKSKFGRDTQANMEEKLIAAPDSTL